MKLRLVHSLLLLCIVGDLVFSFVQHYHQPLDGDLPGILDDNLDLLFAHPFGVQTIAQELHYPNPNRYFSHLAIDFYMLKMPVFLQHFVSPTTSVFLANALLKTTVQVLLIGLLTTLIFGRINLRCLSTASTVLLLCTLFQSMGYVRYMGVIDVSITYVFFYALPIVPLLLVAFPLLHFALHKKAIQFSILHWIIWTGLAVVTCLSGPLNPGIILSAITAAIFWFFLHQWRRPNTKEVTKRIPNKPPKAAWIMIVVLGLLSIYSLYLGTYTSNLAESGVGILERYTRLPVGLYYQLVSKPGFLLMGSGILILLLLKRRQLSVAQNSQIRNVGLGLLSFSVVYIFLLPLGGFKDYRANILRYDTFLPVTLCCMFYFCFVAKFSIALLFAHLKSKNTSGLNKISVGSLAFIAILFTNADRLKTDAYHCQLASLQQIQQAETTDIVLSNECPLLTWGPTTQQSDSQMASQLLQHWNITTSDKRWIQKP